MTTTARNERQFDYTTLEAWGIPRGTDCDHVVTIEDSTACQCLQWEHLKVVFRAPDDHPQPT